MVKRVECAISFNTYKQIAKLYKIRLSHINSEGKRIKKTLKEVRDKIFNFETDQKIKGGLYY